MFAVDDDVRRAEDAFDQSCRAFGFESFLEHRLKQRCRQGGWLGPRLGSQRQDAFAGGNVLPVDKISTEHGMCETAGQGMVLVKQPVIGAGGMLRGDGKGLRLGVGNVHETRRAGEITQEVAAFGRHLRRRRSPRFAQQDAEQNRPPANLAPEPGSERVNAFGCQVAIGRGKIEIKLQRCSHGSS